MIYILFSLLYPGITTDGKDRQMSYDKMKSMGEYAMKGEREI